jgi:hypothetical protein
VSLPEYKKLAVLDGLLSDLLVGSMQEWIFKEIAEAGNSDGKLSLDEFVAYNLRASAASGLTDDGFVGQVELWLELAQSSKVVPMDGESSPEGATAAEAS